MSKRSPAAERGPVPPGPSVNRVLVNLPGALLARWWPSFQLMSLAPAQMLEDRATSDHLYFPLSCVLSLQYALEDGVAAHIAFIGREGFAGAGSLAGGQSPFVRHLVVAQGHALRLPTATFASELERNEFPILRQLVSGHLHSLLVQAAQRAACSRHHTPQQQLATLLLLASDESAPAQLDMTHDIIAGMLGMRRETVSHAAYRMQQRGLLKYRRGHIAVIAPEELGDLACECYQTLTAEKERLLGVHAPVSSNAA
jgi:CRP-like cAMP-binding protein